MGGKLLWLGLTLIIAIAELCKIVSVFAALVNPVIVAGAIIMIIGLCLYFADK